MSLRVGIVGLPNVGKSTLFNALTKQAAAARNVPFTTIEPNVGIVPVPDARLATLSDMSQSKKIVPTTIEFVDIAGLVRGAHKGEGLGNKFLANIREVDAIIHVVRFFDASDIIHVENKVDPASDVETIHTELALADLATIEKALHREEKLARGNDKAAQERLPILQQLATALESGKLARSVGLTGEALDTIFDIPLLTLKPILFVANVGEDQIMQANELVRDFSQTYAPVLPISIKIEQELIELSDEERLTFLAEYGLNDTGLNRLIQESYRLLNLITFLTTGEQETRAWTVTAGSRAPQAAGKIHSDFERGFIRAETVAYDDLVAAGSYASARAAGKVRDEGKEYIVQDGDVMLFKFSV
jgi:ribosome-binding ATPase